MRYHNSPSKHIRSGILSAKGDIVKHIFFIFFSLCMIILVISSPLCAMGLDTATKYTPRSAAELYDTVPELPGAVPEQATLTSHTDTRSRVPGQRADRRKSVCIFMRQGMPALSEPTTDLQQTTNIKQGQESRRFSVSLSDFSGSEEEEIGESPASGLDNRKNSLTSHGSLTSQVSVPLSPTEQENIEVAIADIRETKDPTIKAEKQNFLLMNVTFSQFEKVTKLFNSIAASIQQGNEETLAQVQATAQQTQQNLQRMVDAQKKQRKLYYLSFGVGICGFGIYLANYLIGSAQEKK